MKRRKQIFPLSSLIVKEEGMQRQSHENQEVRDGYSRIPLAHYICPVTGRVSPGCYEALHFAFPVRESAVGHHRELSLIHHPLYRAVFCLPAQFLKVG